LGDALKSAKGRYAYVERGPVPKREMEEAHREPVSQAKFRWCLPVMFRVLASKRKTQQSKITVVGKKRMYSSLFFTTTVLVHALKWVNRFGSQM